MDAFNQVNLESTDRDWRRDMDAIVKLQELGMVTHFRYAALMSGHSVTLVPATAGAAYGQRPSGIPEREQDSFTLVAIETRHPTMRWIRNDAIKTDDWVQEKFGPSFAKAPDSLALTYLLNSLVVAKLELHGYPSESVADYLETIKKQLLARGEKIGAAAEL
jgi:hypothetical protein